MDVVAHLVDKGVVFNFSSFSYQCCFALLKYFQDLGLIYCVRKATVSYSQKKI